MKPFTQFLIEGQDYYAMAKKSEFDDSGDATNYVDALKTMINSKALSSYMSDTDDNFDSNTVQKLKAVKTAFEAFYQEFMNAE